MIAPLREQLQEYHYTGAQHWRKKIAAVITQDRMIDDNLKRQIKNQTLHTCGLFQETQIFKYISNQSKVFELLPTLFFKIHRVINFQITLDKQFFSTSCRFIYKLGKHFFFINWDSCHAKLNSHYEVWSYKKKKHKKITASGNLFRKNLQLKDVC